MLLPSWGCFSSFRVMRTGPENRSLLLASLVSFFMTLTLINKCILNPFNVLYFITFKFIYFFTLRCRCYNSPYMDRHFKILSELR